MPDLFTLTLIFIVFTTLVGAFIARRKKDICIRDFHQFNTTLELVDGSTKKGVLNVQPTGLELVYNQKESEEDKVLGSYLLYKYELPKLQAIIRYHEDLTEDNKTKRDNDLRRTYKPGFIKKLRRRFSNFFKTFRDSILEILNLFMASFKKAAPMGGALNSQDKYVNKMKTELVDSVGTAYEPLLEKYIGHRVVFEFIKVDKVVRYSGVLKEYSSEFLEIMDVDYAVAEGAFKRADLIMQRKLAVVRNLGE